MSGFDNTNTKTAEPHAAIESNLSSLDYLKSASQEKQLVAMRSDIPEMHFIAADNIKANSVSLANGDQVVITGPEDSHTKCKFPKENFEPVRGFVIMQLDGQLGRVHRKVLGSGTYIQPSEGLKIKIGDKNISVINK